MYHFLLATKELILDPEKYLSNYLNNTKKQIKEDVLNYINLLNEKQAHPINSKEIVLECIKNNSKEVW